MEKKHPILMKQPALGLKILELRKANGLTQEELVERCNLNVRTIQRIEAGEVTPRNYTIRAIMEALNYDLDHLSGLKQNPSETNEASRWIILAFVSGLIYFLLAFWEGWMDYSLWRSATTAFSPLVYTLVKITVALLFCGFMSGFYMLSRVWSNDWIKVGTLLLGIGTLVCIAADLYLFHQTPDSPEGILASQAIGMGAVYLVFGVGLVKYQREFGQLALVSGVLGIITGLAFLSVILAIPGLLVLAVFEILCLIMLYRAYEKTQPVEVNHNPQKDVA